MTGRPLRWPLGWYFAAVVSAGALVLTVLATRGGLQAGLQVPASFWVLALLFAVSEVLPVATPRRGDVIEFTTSTTFALALLVGWGLRAAAPTVAIFCALGDLVQRKPIRKAPFNAAQYVLALTAASGVLQLLGGMRFSLRWFLAFMLAALVYALVNRMLIGLVVSLDTGGSPRNAWKHFSIAALPEAVLVAMAPIAVLLADRGAPMVLLLPLPMVGAYVMCKAAISAEASRAKAEAAAAEARQLAAEKARIAEAERDVVRRLIESDQLKDKLLSSVSHELRTPLAGVLGAVLTLQSREDVLSDEQRRELLEMAARQGERLKELIEQLLLAAQVHASGDPLPNRHPPVDAGDLARGAVAAARARHPGREIQLAVEDDLPVHAAPEAVLQAVSSLLDNAAKYAPPGTPVWVDALRGGSLVVIAVEDSGPGVPPARREWIFGRFGKLDGNARGASGVGLGLYIARRLARAEGGDLVLTEPTRPGAGARFELRLPPALTWEARSVADSLTADIAQAAEETEPRPTHT